MIGLITATIKVVMIAFIVFQAMKLIEGYSDGKKAVDCGVGEWRRRNEALRGKVYFLILSFFVTAVFFTLESEYRPKNNLEDSIPMQVEHQPKAIKFVPSNNNLGKEDNGELASQKNTEENVQAVTEFNE